MTTTTKIWITIEYPEGVVIFRRQRYIEGEKWGEEYSETVAPGDFERAEVIIRDANDSQPPPTDEAGAFRTRGITPLSSTKGIAEEHPILTALSNLWTPAMIKEYKANQEANLEKLKSTALDLPLSGEPSGLSAI